MGELQEAVRVLIRRHAFRRGQLGVEGIAADFAVPMIAYHRDGILLYRTQDEIAVAVVAYFDNLRDANVERVEPVILEIRPGGPDRLTALVDWQQVRADGRIVGVNRSRIFFRRARGTGALLIELVEYLSVAQVSLFPNQMAESRRQS